MSDLVKRLHDLAACKHDDLSIAKEAAAEIDRLRAEVGRLLSDLPYVIGWNDGFDHAMKKTLEMQFPTMLRKMWSGQEVQTWLDKQIAVARAALEGK